MAFRGGSNNLKFVRFKIFDFGRSGQEKMFVFGDMCFRAIFIFFI